VTSQLPRKRVLVLVPDDRLDGARELASLDDLYTRYHRRLFGFLCRLAGAPDPAEDLFQEAWLRIARGWATLARTADVEAWLFTVTRNVFISRHRARTVERRGLDRLAQLPEAAPARPDQLLDSSLAVADLERAFATLPDDDRAILWLVAVEDMDQDQVAQVFDVSYSALRQRLSRARARLNQALAEGGPQTRSGSCP
jgi:RNA polymerase sigma factor (sigma-70 family)